MLLRGYRKEIFRPECNPSFQSLHCIAQLEGDVSQVLPYLNAVLGGTCYIDDPPSLTLKVHGKLITIHARAIAINALDDEAQADRILKWLSREINEAWENRHEIEPSFGDRPRPKILEILKRLPRTNCRQCGQPTCMVFASLVAEGGKGPEDCPELGTRERQLMTAYLGHFHIAGEKGDLGGDWEGS